MTSIHYFFIMNRLSHLVAFLLSLFVPGATLLGQQAVWDTLPIAFNSSPRFLFEDTTEDKLYIGGNFWKVNGDPVNHLVRFDGTNYDLPALDSAGVHLLLPQTPLMMQLYEEKLYLGGFGGLIQYQNHNWNWLDFNNAVELAAILSR